MRRRLREEVDKRLKSLILSWGISPRLVTPHLVANMTLLNERQALAVLKRLDPARYFGTRVEGGAT